MSKSKSTTAPKCMVCGSNHWGRDPHIWKDEPENVHLEELIATSIKKSRPKPKTSRPKPLMDNMSRQLRTVTVKQLYKNLSEELKDLPFIVTKNGKDIARVEKAKK